MIERSGPLSLSRQCQLLGLNRAALYYQAAPVDAYELELTALLDRQYLRTPFYGSWRMTVWLQTQGHKNAALGAGRCRPFIASPPRPPDACRGRSRPGDAPRHILCRGRSRLIH